MGLKSTLRKGLALAKKYAEQFEEAPSSYTPDSVVGKVQKRITDRIVALTPGLADTVSFKRASGFVGPDIAFEGFWRGVLVEAANQGPGNQSRNGSGTPFGVDISIEIGYPGFPIVLASGVTYNVPEIKASDAKIIDALMFGGDLFTSPTDLGIAAGVRALGGFYDVGNTKRRARYILEIIEVYP
jgi:hypothetical protein